MPGHGHNETYRNADGEKQHHYHHTAGSHLFALHAQQADQPHHRQCHQGLPQIDLIAEYGKKIPSFEDPLKEISGKQRDACGVCPENGYIDQEHEPGDQEGAVISEDIFHIVVQTSCPRITVCQKMIMTGHHQHHDKSQQQADNGAQRSRLGKIGTAGNNKRSPSYG